MIFKIILFAFAFLIAVGLVMVKHMAKQQEKEYMAEKKEDQDQ